jgi:hypothetical protein
MIPTSLTSPTYQDIFLLLRQKQLLNNIVRNSNVDQRPKMNLQQNWTKSNDYSVGTTTNSNSNLSQQLQTLLLLGAVSKASSNIENQSPNLPALLSLAQNKLKERAIMELGMVLNGCQKQQTLPKPQPLGISDELNRVDKQQCGTIDALTMTHAIPPFESEVELPEPHLIDPKSKKIRKINLCGHPERPHYAKNMCNQCYHKYGRTKKPWRCSHDRLYAHGLCQNCYINAYNKQRSQKMKEEKNEPTLNSEGNELLPEIPPLDTKEPLTVEDKTAFSDLEQNEEKEEHSEQ